MMAKMPIQSYKNKEYAVITYGYNGKKNAIKCSKKLN